MSDRGRVVPAIRTASTGLERVLLVLLTLVMTTLLVAGMAQVVARYVLEVSIVWPEETARYMMTGGTFLAIPVLTLRRRHIAVDAVMYYLRSATGRRWLHRLLTVLEAAFLGVLARLAYVPMIDARDSGQVSAAMQVPVWWPLAAVFLGCLLGALVAVGRVVVAFIDPDDGWSPPEGIQSLGAGPGVPAGGSA